jgi:hypothetical protein
MMVLLFLASTVLPAKAQEPISIFGAISNSNTVMYVGTHPDDERSINSALARLTGAGKKL